MKNPVAPMHLSLSDIAYQEEANESDWICQLFRVPLLPVMRGRRMSGPSYSRPRPMIRDPNNMGAARRVKKQDILHRSCPYLRRILTDFQNSFAGRVSRKFAIKRSLQISSYLKDVACEILIFLNICTKKAQKWQIKHTCIEECDCGR